MKEQPNSVIFNDFYLAFMLWLMQSNKVQRWKKPITIVSEISQKAKYTVRDLIRLLLPPRYGG